MSEKWWPYNPESWKITLLCSKEIGNGSPMILTVGIVGSSMPWASSTFMVLVMIIHDSLVSA